MAGEVAKDVDGDPPGGNFPLVAAGCRRCEPMLRDDQPLGGVARFHAETATLPRSALFHSAEACAFTEVRVTG
ncbi:MAG: hypothetical protein QOF18_66 [Frankiaceae bacterium]|jgi:hypothetical protein|nr:hypothetical protein [Frankiaceae bacterium]